MCMICVQDIYFCQKQNLEYSHLLYQLTCCSIVRSNKLCHPRRSFSFSICKKRYEVMKKLLIIGANPNLPDATRDHVLQIPQICNNIELLLKYFSSYHIDFGLNLEFINISSGMTPLTKNIF